MLSAPGIRFKLRCARPCGPRRALPAHCHQPVAAADSGARAPRESRVIGRCCRRRWQWIDLTAALCRCDCRRRLGPSWHAAG
eukprot:scaffold121_cov120-Isochrysis_galbana.AAC.1